MGCPGLQDATVDVDFSELAWQGEKHNLHTLFYGVAGSMHRIYSSISGNVKVPELPIVACQKQSFTGCLLLYFSNNMILIQSKNVDLSHTKKNGAASA